MRTFLKDVLVAYRYRVGMPKFILRMKKNGQKFDQLYC